MSTETGTYQGGFWTIIASNLNAKDRVHPNLDQDQSTINETVMTDYGGYNREINTLDLEFLNEESDIPGATYSEHGNTFFDRQTGALVQLEDTHTYHNPDIAFAVTWKLVSQNSWTGSEENQALSLPMIILVVVVAFVVVTLLIVLAHRKKQHNRKK